MSREISPLGSGVVSVTFVKAGDAYNVIPDSVELGGTIRRARNSGDVVKNISLRPAATATQLLKISTFCIICRALSLDQLLTLQGRVKDMSASVASGFGCNVTVSWRLDEQPLYPPTVNDAASVQFTKEVASG